MDASQNNPLVIRAVEKPSFRRGLLAAVFLLVAGSANAHDSWLRIAEAQLGSGLLVLELAEGRRYPVAEGPALAASVVQAACDDPAGQRRPLVVRGERMQALELRARIDTAPGAACWADLRPVEVELTAEQVQVYLDEIRASAAVRKQWEQQQSRGIRWREVYRKQMRIELPGVATSSTSDRSTLRRPLRQGLELLPLGAGAVRARQPSAFQALLDGAPVAQLPVEFVSERHTTGIWRETDSEGRVTLALPFAGRWLLRTTLLDVPHAPEQPWRSRFSTLAIQVE